WIGGSSENESDMTFNHPYHMLIFLEKAFYRRFVYALESIQHRKTNARSGSKVDTRLDIFGKPQPAVAEPGLKKLSADAPIEPHRAGYFLNVRAKFFAQVGDDVRIADL